MLAGMSHEKFREKCFAKFFFRDTLFVMVAVIVLIVAVIVCICVVIVCVFAVAIAFEGSAR